MVKKTKRNRRVENTRSHSGLTSQTSGSGYAFKIRRQSFQFIECFDDVTSLMKWNSKKVNSIYLSYISFYYLDRKLNGRIFTVFKTIIKNKLYLFGCINSFHLLEIKFIGDCFQNDAYDALFFSQFLATYRDLE